MGFTNPIIGGAAALIRAAIKSPNYVPHTSGWSINKDGSAEFTNVTARGTVEVDASSGLGKIIIDGNGLSVYDNLGQLAVQIDTTNTAFDSILNALSAGIGFLQVPAFEATPGGRAALTINTTTVNGTPAVDSDVTFMNSSCTLAVIDSRTGGSFHYPDFCLGQSVTSPRADEFLAAPIGIVGPIKRTAVGSAGVALGVEAKDTNLGDTQFIADAGRAYTIVYRTRCRTTGIPTTMDLRLRGNNSLVSPTTASPQLDSSFSVPLGVATAGAGATTVTAEFTVQCPSDIAAGLWTIAGFFACTAGAGTVSVDSARTLLVKDIGTGV